MSLTFVVTGANRGIGLEFASQLSKKGEAVIATARDPGKARDLQALGVRVEPLDVEDTGSVANFARRLAGLPLDVLINNAGIGQAGSTIDRLSIEEVERFFRINSIGPLRVTQALLPNLRASNRKLVVNITSVLGSIDRNDSGGWYGYRAAKTALNQLTRTLAHELAPEGFTCVVLHPGWVRTDMGGPEATLSPEESVRGMLRVIGKLSRRDTGRFLNYRGKEVPW